MDARFEPALTTAYATARLEEGRGKVDETHDRMHPKLPYTDIIMNVAVYRAATLSVTAEMMNPMLQNTCGQTTCSHRSRVLSECHEFVIPRMAANTYGGADNNRVRVLSYPSVLTIVGKKFVNAAAVFKHNCMNHKM